MTERYGIRISIIKRGTEKDCKRELTSAGHIAMDAVERAILILEDGEEVVVEGESGTTLTAHIRPIEEAENEEAI